MVTETSPSLSRRVHAADRLHILGQELFRRVLIAERRRADRVSQPSVVLIVEARYRWRGTPSVMWKETIAALAACTRETDIVGWLDHKTRIGVILHAIAPATAANPAVLEVRIRRELARHIEPNIVARVSIRTHVHHLLDTTDDPLRADDDPFARTQSRPCIETGTVYDGIKRFVDIVGSLTLLVALLPVLLLVAASVKLKSPGPVFFGQVRIGRMMKPFRMLKFRTMHVNADHALHQAFVSQFITASAGPNAPGANGVFKIVDDPRVTPIGHVLRRTSLDELPQLLNVLWGDMSLVGPRPPLAYEVEQYKPWHTRRVIDAKPGLTGLWQVGGRSRTNFEDMVRLDLQYAKRCSLWTDIKILLATPRAVLLGKGAC